MHILWADGDEDLDGDGISNAAEFAAGTHPDGANTNTRYLAEGATGAFFNTSLALFNPGPAHATAVLRFTTNAGVAARHIILVPAGTRHHRREHHRRPRQHIVLDRRRIRRNNRGRSHDDVGRRLWKSRRYGDRHAVAVLVSRRGLDLRRFPVVLSAPESARRERLGDREISAAVRAAADRAHLHAAAELAHDDRGGRRRRPRLHRPDVSAAISATAPIIVERAMCRSSPTQTFAAGHESAGVTSPATRWFLAEGATGPFFDLFILIANPNPSPADVRVDYLLSTGETHSKVYTLAPDSRFTIWVDDEQLPEGSGIKPLANVAVSSTITSINHVPIVVERTMWWPGLGAMGMGGAFWSEAHNSPGATETGAAWALAEGRSADRCPPRPTS